MRFYEIRKIALKPTYTYKSYPGKGDMRNDHHKNFKAPYAIRLQISPGSYEIYRFFDKQKLFRRLKRFVFLHFQKLRHEYPGVENDWDPTDTVGHEERIKYNGWPIRYWYEGAIEGYPKVVMTDIGINIGLIPGEEFENLLNKDILDPETYIDKK